MSREGKKEISAAQSQRRALEGIGASVRVLQEGMTSRELEKVSDQGHRIRAENAGDVQKLLPAHLGMKIKSVKTENQEEVIVCQAFDEICSDIHEKGRAEGIIEGETRGRAAGEAQEREKGIRALIDSYLRHGFSIDEIIRELGLLYNLTPQDAKAYLA